METFASSLAVSPRARSGNSLLSRSRGHRHGRLGRNSLGGDGQHTVFKTSTSLRIAKEEKRINIGGGMLGRYVVAGESIIEERSKATSLLEPRPFLSY